MSISSEIQALPSLRREQSLGDQIYLELKHLLIAGKLVPGVRLSLRKVAEKMQVSIMPVRDAVSRLVAEGALDVLANRAVRVPIMTRSKFEELAIVRIGIEGFAAELAAANRSSADLDRIKSFDEAFRYQSRLGRMEVGGVLALNKELHFAVYAASGSSLLCSLIETLWLQVGPVINFDLSSAERIATGVAQGHHADLITALITQDREAAKAAVAADIGDSAKFILGTGSLPE